MDSEASLLLSNQDDFSTQQHEEPSADFQAELQTTFVTVHPIAADDLPPPYSPSPHGFPIDSQAEPQATYVTVHPIGTDDLPPPNSPSPHGILMIACKVCGFIIDITGKSDQPLVKCDSCNEVTPIKSPQPGEMFVRCTCQSLLVCKSGPQTISCPRDTCKRLLNVVPHYADPFLPNVPGMCQVSCAHCHRHFKFILTHSLATCVYCGKVSSVGEQFPRICAILYYLTAAFFFLFIGLGATLGLFPGDKDMCFYAVFGALLGRAVFYFAMKVSHIENPV